MGGFELWSWVLPPLAVAFLAACGWLGVRDAMRPYEPPSPAALDLLRALHAEGGFCEADVPDTPAGAELLAKGFIEACGPPASDWMQVTRRGHRALGQRLDGPDVHGEPSRWIAGPRRLFAPGERPRPVRQSVRGRAVARRCARKAAPRVAKPRSRVAQVAGSGTAPVAAVR